MPKKEGKKPAFDKGLKQQAKQLANQYVVYEKRLGERTVLSPEERQNKIRDFLNLYKDELNGILFGLMEFYAQNNVSGRMNVDEAGKQAGLTESQRMLLKQFIANETKGEMKTSDRINTNSFLLGEVARDIIEKKSKYNTTFGQSSQEAISPGAAAKTKEILKWLYKHSERRTAAAEGTQQLGDKSYMPFVEAIAGRPVSQQAKIFYLVCVGHTKQCTENDMKQALLKGPDLKDFRSKMNRSKANFFARIFGRKVQWDLLSQAIVLVDEKLQHGQGYVEDGEDEAAAEANEIKAEKKAAQDEAGKEVNEGSSLHAREAALIKELGLDMDTTETVIKVGGYEANDESEAAEEPEEAAENQDEEKQPTRRASMYNRETEDKIVSLEDEIKTLQQDKTLPEKEKTKKLKECVEKLKEILEQQKRLLDGKTGVEDEISGKIAWGTYVKYAATVLDNVAIMDAAMGLAVIADAASVISRFVNLANNYDNMQKKDVAKQTVYITKTLATLANDTGKLTRLTGYVKSGMSVTAASTALSNNPVFNTASNAVSIITSAATVTVGAIQAQEARDIKKGANAAEERFQKVSDEAKKKDDTDLYANDLTAYAKSMAKTRALTAATNVVYGSLSTVASVISLTGLGALVGAVVTGASYLALIGGYLAQFIVKGLEADKVLDRFFGIDKAVEVFKKRFDQIYTRYDEKGKKKGPSYWERQFIDGMEKDIRKQLRTYGEALLGVTSDSAAINIIRTRYAEYLWKKVFLRPTGDGSGKRYWESGDWNDTSEQMGDDDLIRYACKNLVSGIGVPCKFSEDGHRAPKTTMGDVKKNLQLG